MEKTQPKRSAQPPSEQCVDINARVLLPFEPYMFCASGRVEVVELKGRVFTNPAMIFSKK
jgi:hypothetical protein